MQLGKLKDDKFDEFKKIFLDVFSNEPWFDKWESDEQLTAYISELIYNKNSLALAFYDDNGVIAGGAMGYVFSWWSGPEYFIKEFFISRDNQKQGVGSNFLTQITDYLRTEGIRAVWLMTEKNIPAYHFYKKNGFNEVEKNILFWKCIKN